MGIKEAVVTVTVITAGIAGVYAAYRVVKKARQEGLSIPTVIVQAYNTTVDEIRNKL